jgi:hypothetical protein
MPTQPRLVTTADDCRERALAALHYEKARVAAINLRRYLLDAVRSGSLNDEVDARRLLGQTYCDTQNLVDTAYYSIQGGDYETAPVAAAAFGDAYQDVTEFMKGPLSWVVASALQFATEQADLIPDDEVESVVELAIAAINDAMTGTRVESPILSPQMYLSAYGLLAALAARLSATQARAVLDMLAGAVVVKEHHYRPTDGSHVEIAAGIVRTHTTVNFTPWLLTNSWDYMPAERIRSELPRAIRSSPTSTRSLIGCKRSPTSATAKPLP